MKTNVKKLFNDAGELPPAERIDLVDNILSTLDMPDKKINELWKKEAEERIKAFKCGKIKSYTLKEVIAKYMK